MKSRLLAFAMLTAFINPSSGNAEPLKYGEKFRFKPGNEIEFADFRLTFLGTKQNVFYPGSTNRRLGEIYEFQVLNAAETQTITWSSGTGDIGPALFEAAGKCFRLELQRSDQLGVLEETEAVVSLDTRNPESCKPQP